MAELPRLSEILLPDDKPIIYFVTLCVEGRRPVLADAEDWPFSLDSISDEKLTASPRKSGEA
jgi:hypothetical protein